MLYIVPICFLILLFHIDTTNFHTSRAVYVRSSIFFYKKLEYRINNLVFKNNNFNLLPAKTVTTQIDCAVKP
ncbi:hypothetical protein CHU_2909 [Cytophaga hutchinsonii ATCC 33406]|uniref:Uncharacterized protein n=1 Tax=Cytophaga hutchinsonii (strain ATCC 33406 / DSM 1761 / CIP 103989 / NBRC 15051 / NCIMB 9469 / D465) TaxID=269798 RepID=A0A6N4SUR7_CYTH3|nr:hypothetical protein CHU_2909 [Cytophaga hutchinsonii ATCC 33406]